MLSIINEHQSKRNTTGCIPILLRSTSFGKLTSPDVKAEIPSVAMSAGPRAISLEEYRARQSSRRPSEEPIIPIVQRPRRRGGYVWRYKKELSILHSCLKTKPPPSWDTATEIWQRIFKIEFLIQQYLKNRRQN